MPKPENKMSELEKAYRDLKSLAYQVKLQEELIDNLERVERGKEREMVARQLCACGHERKRHGKSFSVNFTDGACIDCGCTGFCLGNVQTE